MPVNLNGVEVTPKAHLDSIKIGDYLWPLDFFRLFNKAPGILVLREKPGTRELEVVSFEPASLASKLLNFVFSRQ